MIVPIFTDIATVPQPQYEDVPAERCRDAGCSDVCYVFFLFMITFGISMIIFVVICILQKRNVIIQMFEFTTCQHYGDNFNGPFHGGNNGGSPGGPIIPKRMANPVQGNGSIQRPNQ